jgi:hypothetical protein
VREAKIDDDQFKQLAADAGLKPFDKTKSESELSDLGRLKNSVETQIDAEQRATGKALTRERKARSRRSSSTRKFCNRRGIRSARSARTKCRPRW